ncbi:hypothetical protein PMIT1318_02126 [Prochlorococcus marinus str. MIT 1318]|uniref:hypothetical protein n=1 Tax=Prochlorococcus TaxID=1218 RepID=UPI0007B3CF86|nr:hypothetical protein [Prochlorococcus marinus]KZR70984.1 hypothetical protein PMIT1318_02126 [Prochlorococcus marinus str. MIT 1318]
MAIIYQLTFLLSVIIVAYIIGWSMTGYVFKAPRDLSSKPFLVIAIGLAWIVIASAWALLLSRLFPFYIYLQYTIVFTPVFVAILLRKRIQVHSTIKQHAARLLQVSWLFFVPTLILVASGIMSSMHHKVQFGVDSALYIQLAHHLLRSPTNPTDVSNLVETGNLAWAGFVQSHRWGLPLLVQFFSSSIFSDLAKNSYTLCSVFIVLPAGLIVENLPVVNDANKRISILRRYVLLPCVGLNWFLFSLLLEGQWPNLVALTFYFLASIFIVDSLYDILSLNSTKLISLWKIVLSALFFSAACTIYGEFFLLHWMSVSILIAVSLGLSIRSVYSIGFKVGVVLLRYLLVVVGSSIFLCLPYLQRAFSHTTEIKLTSVGYPQPRPLLLPDLLGIDSPWLLDDWRSQINSLTEAGQAVNRLVDSSDIKYYVLLAFVGICALAALCISFAFYELDLSSRQGKLFYTFALLVPTYSLVATFYTFKSVSGAGVNADYIWLKLCSYLFLFFQYLVLSVLSISLANKKDLTRASIDQSFYGRSLSYLFASLYSAMVAFTCFFYLNLFSEHSARARILSEETKNLLSSEYSDCIIVLPPRGVSRTERRWADRTKEFITTSTSPNATSSSRALRFLDSWSLRVEHMSSLAHPLSMTGNICLLVDTSRDSYDRRFIQANHRLSDWQRTLPDDWTLYVTDYTFGDLQRIGTVNLYRKLYRGIKN